jgi:hypothetical protein
MNTHSTTIKNIKKSLKNTTGFVIIIYKIITGLVVEGLKKFWNNWQWVLALVALLYGIFLFYYQSSTATPARLTKCEDFIQESQKVHENILARLASDEIKFDTTTARIETSLEAISTDLQFIKHELIKKAM